MKHRGWGIEIDMDFHDLFYLHMPESRKLKENELKT